jgi:hypothetical protein
MFEHHTVENMFNMVVKFFDALYGRWRNKLIEVSFDGENTMTVRHAHGSICFQQGVVCPVHTTLD